MFEELKGGCVAVGCVTMFQLRVELLVDWIASRRFAVTPLRNPFRMYPVRGGGIGSARVVAAARRRPWQRQLQHSCGGQQGGRVTPRPYPPLLVVGAARAGVKDNNQPATVAMDSATAT